MTVVFLVGGSGAPAFTRWEEVHAVHTTQIAKLSIDVSGGFTADAIFSFYKVHRCMPSPAAEIANSNVHRSVNAITMEQ